MGYAISGPQFEHARAALARAKMSTPLVGVYSYTDGTIHVVTSEDDSTPRVVLSKNVHADHRYDVDAERTKVYNEKRVETLLKESERQKLMAAERQRREDMRTVFVKRRADDVMAYIKGAPEHWDCGKTPDAAIGALMRTHGDKLGVRIVIDEPTETVTVLR